MINALIQNGDQTAVLKLPDDPFTLQYDLSQIGVRIRLRDIPIKDDEDSAIQVKLFADSDIGNNLAVLFKPSHSLEDANLCAYMVENARPEISEELEQHIVHGQYYSPQALMADIKAMTEGLIGVTVNYYCPLQIHMTDEEYGDCFEVDNGYGIANEDAIRELVKREQDRDLHNTAILRIIRRISIMKRYRRMALIIRDWRKRCLASRANSCCHIMTARSSGNCIPAPAS